MLFLEEDFVVVVNPGAGTSSMRVMSHHRYMDGLHGRGRGERGEGRGPLLEEKQKKWVIKLIGS